MKNSGKIALFLILVAGAGIALYGWQHSSAPEALPVPVSSASPVVGDGAQSGIQYPVPEETQEPNEPGPGQSPSGGTVSKKLPALDQSDTTILTSLQNLIGNALFDLLFHSEDVVRRMVVTIDTMTAHRQPSQEMSCLKPLESSFRVSGKGDSLAIAPGNFDRYKPYAELARTLDARKLVAVYVRFYPLLQTAYRELGTQGYFNDRVVQVIDHALSAPVLEGPISLVPAEVVGRYKYADPQVESRSAVQRALIRMGSENAGAIKDKLREIRGLLTHLRKHSR